MFESIFLKVKGILSSVGRDPTVNIVTNNNVTIFIPLFVSGVTFNRY